MASLSESILSLATRAGQECKALHNKIGELSSLNTTVKTSTVAALNELVAALESIRTEQSSLINDETASAATTYSSSKIADLILAARNAVKDELLNGAGEAYDTLKELADLIQSNQSAIEALQTLAAGHVKYDAAQELTDPQKAQARTNIGAASASELSTLSTKVGDTTSNFVTAFETALAGTVEA